MASFIYPPIFPLIEGKLKKGILKGLCITALSLGLFVSSPVIHPTNSFASYDIEGSKFEYSTHGWSFTREEMKILYEKEYEEGKRFENSIRMINGKYLASHSGQEFEVPENFVKHTLKHLEQMLEKGYAEYLFRIDAYHGHIFVPEKNAYKYKNLIGNKLIEAYTKDEALGILYHNSEHLTAKDMKTGDVDPKAEDLIKKRNVLGWYDGRDVELTYPRKNALPKHKEANSADEPENTYHVGALNFKATKNGEFTIKHNGKEIKVDISFDDFYYY